MTAHRKSLHWLPVRQRIEHKIAVMTFKARNTQGPVYISELISDYVPTRTLRSAGPAKLHEPRSTLNFGSTAFSRAAPRIWNGLQSDCRCCTSLAPFKKLLKTELFSRAYMN